MPVLRFRFVPKPQHSLRRTETVTPAPPGSDPTSSAAVHAAVDLLAATIQRAVDRFTTPIETTVDAVTALIEPLLDAVAAAVRSLGGIRGNLHRAREQS